MAKLKPTSFDYLVMTLNPALVMVLVGSLVYFLIEVSYEGEFQTRLCFIMSCFVVATVGITRIAIELDGARASMYGLVLSGAMLFVAPRFAAVPIPLLTLLLAVIWYSAHRLTWDCTLIDEDQDASGEGLLQRIGLDSAPSEAGRDPAGPKAPFWKRLFAPDKSKHAPGLTVVYFSLAALPIFGILQGFIPLSDTEGRGRAFLFLMAYVGSGLGLLLTTSLLGLRRYLRQRQVEMPTDMTATWLAAGATLIGIVLLLSTILPRSARELQLGKSPITFTSADQNAQQAGWGKEGAKGDQQGQGENEKEQNPNGDPGDKQEQGGKPDPNAKQGQQGKGDSKEGNSKQGKSDGKSQGKGNDPNKNSQADDKSDSNNQESSNDPNQKSEQKNEDQKNERDQEKNSKQGEQNNPQNLQRQDPKQQDRPNGQPRQQEQDNSANGRRQSKSAPPSQSMKFSFDPTATAPFLTWLLKVMVIAAIVIVLIYCAIRYRREFLAGIRQFWNELLNFWRGLFGGGKDVEIAPGDITVVSHRRFSEIANPFRRGAVNQNPRELINQTFAALEAWARDQGYPRGKEQTAFEFADSLSSKVGDLAKESKWLADCYSRAAYSSEEVSAQVHSSLATIWQRMEQLYGRIPPPAPTPPGSV